jgi:hypothetical protein
VIERKTAVLFAAATELGGILGGLPESQVAALREYGMQLGYAFQIADDLLDYVSDADTLGKNIGDDLAEGKPTLPVIYALEKSTSGTGAITAPRDRTRRPRFARSHHRRDPRFWRARTHASATRRVSCRCRRAALDALPDSIHRDALLTLARMRSNGHVKRGTGRIQLSRCSLPLSLSACPALSLPVSPDPAARTCGNAPGNRARARRSGLARSTIARTAHPASSSDCAAAPCATRLVLCIHLPAVRMAHHHGQESRDLERLLSIHLLDLQLQILRQQFANENRRSSSVALRMRSPRAGERCRAPSTTRLA